MSTTEASTETIPHSAVLVNESAIIPDRSPDVLKSLETLTLDNAGGKSTSQNGPSIMLGENSTPVTLELPSEATLPANPNNTSSSKAIQNGNAASEGSDRSSPVIVVTPQVAQEQFSQQLQSALCDPIDQPDPRLLGALEHPRDRIFVIKLEKDIVAFINKPSEKVLDMPPMNSYHRLLAHKMAEYYRLTHVADASGASVRIMRGEAARMPPTLLANWPVATQQLQKAASSGALPTVRIMRRHGNGPKLARRTSDKDGTSSLDGSPSKAGSETSSDNDNASGSNSNPNSSSKVTREERKAAYQEARARIFKDFVESPPETPSPGKQEKTRKQDKNDDFSGRSQFYPVMTQPITSQYYPQPYPESMGQHGMPTMQPNMHPLPQNQMPQRFNPAANFVPGGNFSPPQFPATVPPFSTLPSSRSYPNINNTTLDRGYAMTQPMQQPNQQPLYPPSNGYFPSQPPAMARGYNPNPNATPPQMMQSFNPGGYSAQQPAHGMQPPQQFNPATTPPPIHRPTQQFPMPQHPQSFNPQPQGLSPQAQRLPGQLGWGNVGQAPMSGGIAMAPRSSSAPGHVDTVPNGFPGGGLPLQGVNGFSRGPPPPAGAWSGGGWNAASGRRM